jgi:hypothetical protein
MQLVAVGELSETGLRIQVALEQAPAADEKFAARRRLHEGHPPGWPVADDERPAPARGA